MSAPILQQRGDVCVLTIDDPAGLNDGQSDHFRTAVYDQLAAGERARIALDLGMIEFLSSSGVAFLVGLRRRVGALGGKVVLFGVHPYVADLLRGMKLAALFPTAVDLDAAIAAFPPLPTV